MNNQDIPAQGVDTTESGPAKEAHPQRFTVVVVWRDSAHQRKVVKDCVSICLSEEDIVLKDAGGNEYVLSRAGILYYTVNASKEPPKLADTVARLNREE